MHAILVLGVLLVGVAFLSASFSPRQPKTVALDVGLSGMRFSLVLFALFWVQELIGREAVLRMRRKMTEPNYVPTTSIVPTRLVVRKSTAPSKQKGAK